MHVEPSSSTGAFARDLPHSLEAEEYLLSCCFIDGRDTLARCIEAKLAPQSFFAPANQLIFEKLIDLYRRAQPLDVAVLAEELKADGRLSAVGGFAYLSQVSSRIPTTAQAPYFITRVGDLAARRELILRAARLVELAHGAGEFSDAASELALAIEQHARVNAGDALVKRALSSEVDPRQPPPADRPVFYVAGKLSSTTGNLTALSGRAKTAKSSLIGAAAAACIAAGRTSEKHVDTLGITSSNPNGRGVVWVDTEQSPAHAAENLRRALTRVGVQPEDKPAWLRLFPLAGWTARELAAVLPNLLKTVAHECGGLHAVFLDGGADFAADVNSSEEAATLCAAWHALAIEHACTFIVIIHSNEARQADDIGRGWLGKQLRRKAESNLTLRRDGDVIVLFGEDGQRHAPIPEREGPRFRWSIDAGMHVSVASGASEREADALSDMRDLAGEVFAGERMRYADVCRRVEHARRVGEKAAEKWFTRLKKAGVIRNVGAGFWEASA